MVNGIAQKFFGYIKEGGPCESGDRYQQIRLDEIDDTIQGYIESPVSLTEEEQEYLDGLVNFDEIDEAIQALMEADLGT
jgi:hypothetical protein